MLLELFSQAPFQRLLLALGHFIWQGAIIAVFSGLISLLFLRRRSAQARYRLYACALMAMAFCVPVTYSILPSAGIAVANANPAPGNLSAPAANASNIESNEQDQVTQTDAAPSDAETKDSPGEEVAAVAMNRRGVEPQLMAPPQSAMAPPQLVRSAYAPYFAMLYVFGVCVMLLRMLVSNAAAARVKRQSIACEDSALIDAITRQAERLGMAAAPGLAFCKRTVVPTVAGVVRPAVLLPISFASGLTPEQIDCILCHELAHIRRRDHQFILLQRLIEAFLFYHPAIWYVSRRLNQERENACDDLVLAGGVAPAVYARGLLALAEEALGQRRVATLHAIDTPSELRRRVHRLLGPDHYTARLPRTAIAAGLMLCAAAAVTFAQVAPEEQGSGDDDSNTPDEYVLSGEKINELQQHLKSGDWWITKRAIEDLSRVTGVSDVGNLSAEEREALMEDLNEDLVFTFENFLRPDKPPQVRVAAATALARTGEEQGVLYLTSMLKDDAVKEQAAQAFQHVDSALAIEYLESAIEEPELKEGVLHALGYVGTPEAVNIILRDMFAFGNPLYDTYRDALAHAPYESLEGPIVEALKSELHTSVFSNFSTLLRRAGGQKSLNAIRQLLRADNEQLRSASIQSLAQYYPDEAPELLIAALSDPDHDVRSDAARALEALGVSITEPRLLARYYVAKGDFLVPPNLRKEAVEPLITAVRTSNRDDNAGDAAEALGALRLPEAIDALGSLLSEPVDADVKRDIIRALYQHGGPEVAPYLAAALNESDDNVRASAAETLRFYATEEQLPALRAALNDPHPGVRIHAAEALGELKDRESVDELVALLQDAEALDTVASALGRIGDPRAIKPMETKVLEDFAGTPVNVRGHPQSQSLMRLLNAIAEIGGNEAIESLTRIRNNTSGQVAAEANNMLNELAQKQRNKNG